MVLHKCLTILLAYALNPIESAEINVFLKSDLKGRPLMIWRGRGNREKKIGGPSPGGKNLEGLPPGKKGKASLRIFFKKGVS